ncbi:hypothetical protein [Chitinophaga sp. sic0106]|uniref:hypothetical protein n=1 Tax=Chitinophaga sp. sic0106 TaxID=2854785 RepID=UPI001C438365|nr:hypothetical protein [Chitinophaga sp. sic0106]MBV7529438.1 hypothetical protein [Chitinophaga sp. sic0106]
MKSFYDNDFLIELNEKRCTEYASLAQQMTARFSMLFVFYSVMLAASMPVVKQLLKVGSVDWMLVIGFTSFGAALVLSIRYAIPLLSAAEPDVLKLPLYYYQFVKEYLLMHIPPNEIALQDVLNEELKLYYKNDLEKLAFQRYKRVIYLQKCFDNSIHYSLSSFVIFLFVFCYYLLHY